MEEAAVIVAELPGNSAGPAPRARRRTRETSPMIDRLRHREMIRQMEMLREMHRRQDSGAPPPAPQRAAPGKRPETPK